MKQYQLYNKNKRLIFLICLATEIYCQAYMPHPISWKKDEPDPFLFNYLHRKNMKSLNSANIWWLKL